MRTGRRVDLAVDPAHHHQGEDFHPGTGGAVPDQLHPAEEDPGHAPDRDPTPPTPRQVSNDSEAQLHQRNCKILQINFITKRKFC